MAHEKELVEKLDNEVFSCVLSMDPATSRWLAHCLNFDLMTSGKDEDSAWQNLIQLVRSHIEHCFTFHQEGLEITASDEEWEHFRAMRKVQKPIRSEKVTLRLVKPIHAEPKQFWMEGVDSVPSVSDGAIPARLH